MSNGDTTQSSAEQLGSELRVDPAYAPIRTSYQPFRDPFPWQDKAVVSLLLMILSLIVLRVTGRTIAASLQLLEVALPHGPSPTFLDMVAVPVTMAVTSFLLWWKLSNPPPFGELIGLNLPDNLGWRIALTALSLVLLGELGVMSYLGVWSDSIARRLTIGTAWLPIGEEIFFRGLLLALLRQGFLNSGWKDKGATYAASFLAGAAFSASHIGVDSLSRVNIFLTGTLFGIAYKESRSLLVPCALHVAWNWLLFYIRLTL